MHKKLLKLYLLILVLALLIVNVKIACADASSTITYIPQIKEIAGNKLTFDKTTGALANYIKSIYNYGVGVAAIVATIVLMIGGFQWLTSGGSGEKVGEAKAWITAAFSGLVLVLGSYMILDLINPNLVNLKISTIKKIEKIEESEEVPEYTSGGGRNIMSSNITTFDSQLKLAAAEFGVDCNELKAFMYTESTGNPNAKGRPITNKKGEVQQAQGLMQLMPSTAKGLGFTSNLLDPLTNLRAGAKYIKELKTTACNGKAKIENPAGFSNACSVSNPRYIYAAYNGGTKANTPSTDCPGQTYWQCHTNKGYAETRDYVNKVTSNLNAINANGWGCR